MSAVESAVRAAVVRIGAVDQGYDARYDSRRRGVFWGSGFFIAPGWVLTSAHVVGKGRGGVWRGERVIGITTESGATFTGELACGLPLPPDAERPPSPWGEPDLALIRVPESPDEPHPNGLWLSDRSALTPADVELYGYSSAFSGDEVAYVQGSGRAGGGTGGPMTLEHANLPSGCSGGPVVDRDRGSVIGVNKGRASDGRPFAHATPITALRRFCEAGPGPARVWREALRAHDQHHLERFRGYGWSWPREQYDRESRHDAHGYASGFTAYDRAELFGRLAELPPPQSSGQVLRTVKEAREAVLRESYRLELHAPRSWREGVGLLYAPHDGHAPPGEGSRDLERAAVVLYAARVYEMLAAPGAADAEAKNGQPDSATGQLRTWIEGAARNVRNGVLRGRVRDILEGAQEAGDGGAEAPAAVGGEQGFTASHADVLVEIDPDLYGTHPWRIKLIHKDGRVTPVRNSETGVPRQRLEADVRAALADALDRGDIGEHLAAVDFVLPRALFDEPVDMWRLKPEGSEGLTEHTLPLGHRRTIALRDRQRSGGKAAPEWQRRWGVVSQGRLMAVPLCGDSARDGHGGAPCESELAAYGRLRATAWNAVPVHCARAGSGKGATALGAAIAAGHPAALWRRCDEQHTDCEEFYERAGELLRSAGGADEPCGLRERVRDLRNRNADPGVLDPVAAWAQQLVLLYDPPHGPQLPVGPLRAPPLRA